MMENDEPTIKDVLEAINVFSDRTDERFAKIDARLDKIEGRLDKIEGRLDKIEGRLDKIEGRLDTIESTMVTKYYLDDKIADVKGELRMLVSILLRRSIINEEEKRQIFGLEPIPESP